ncbi:MAG: T9SS type A sorting domain-containing protein [Chitinophagaceae bacterium]|nr:T9SS type A sorting domain-containing protein [Chitinophagaceae bacterium]
MKNNYLLILCLLISSKMFATVWEVGPTKTYTNCTQVAPLVQHGDTVIIDTFNFVNQDQVVWTKNDLLIYGGISSNGTKLIAGNALATNSNGKGIFVIQGNNVRVYNLFFENAKVVDMNGAGIRQEGKNLQVQNCVFLNNENGILTGAIPDCKTTITYCEFNNNGSPLNPGYQHNVYIGHIDSLVFKFNVCKNATAEGHELKSRAKYNFIMYNLFLNDTTEDSRNIDLPNGGTVVMVGNTITQSSFSANNNMMGYGLEGLTNAAPHNLWMTNNTFVNYKSVGSFINIASGTDSIFFKNNIIAGANNGGTIVGTANFTDTSNNVESTNIADFKFFSSVCFMLNDYSTIARNKGILILDSILGYELNPYYEYYSFVIGDLHPRSIQLFIIDAGANEYYPNGINIKEHYLNNIGITIYPNPINDVLYISANKNIEITHLKIFNQLGQIVFSSLIKDNLKCNISSLKAGNYIMALYNKDKILGTQKILKH